MAINDKVRVSTLDDWYLVLSKMYNQLKAENASRYDTDIGKDFKTTSMLNPGAKAKAEHISHIINGINALNGKDSDGNIPTDKDDLKVYFWYSDWKTPPGEIQVGDTKIKIKSQLKNDINNTISELKQICVNNSKEKVLMCQYDADHSYDKSVCNEYDCPEHECNETTVTNATTPTNSQTYHSTSYNSRTVSHNKDTVTTTYSKTSNATVTVIKSNSIETKYSKKCTKCSETSNSKSSYNINCNQVRYPGCSANITNTNWYTNGKTKENSKKTSNTNNSKYPNTKENGYSQTITKKNSVKPSDSITPQGLTNSTSTSYDRTHYSTEARNTVTPNSTIISYSQDLSNTDNVRRIQSCNKCAPDCAQDIRCQTYNIGYSVKANGDGTYKTFVCSDTINLDKYLYIK